MGAQTPESALRRNLAAEKQREQDRISQKNYGLPHSVTSKFTSAEAHERHNHWMVAQALRISLEQAAALSDEEREGRMDIHERLEVLSHLNVQELMVMDRADYEQKVIDELIKVIRQVSFGIEHAGYPAKFEWEFDGFELMIGYKDAAMKKPKMAASWYIKKLDDGRGLWIAPGLKSLITTGIKDYSPSKPFPVVITDEMLDTELTHADRVELFVQLRNLMKKRNEELRDAMRSPSLDSDRDLSYR